MTLTDGLMILAVLLAPFLAVFAQRQVETWRERRGRKLNVFKALMASRGATLSPQHVQALNMIELEFDAPTDEPVRRAWREYLDHLDSGPKGAEPSREAMLLWIQQTDSLLGKLLGVMGRTLGYDFDPVAIRKGAYAPKGHADLESEQQAIRRQLLEVLSGERTLRFTGVPADEEAASAGEQLRRSILAVLTGQQAVNVRFVGEGHADAPKRGK